MPKPKVFIARRIFQEAIDMIAAEADVELWPDELPPPRETLLKKVANVDGLLCLLTDKVDAQAHGRRPQPARHQPDRRRL